MQKQLPTLEQFKLLSKRYHENQNTNSLSEAKEILSAYYGYANWRAIRTHLKDIPRSDKVIQGLNLCLLGGSGSGKTSLLLSLKEKLDTPTTLMINFKNNEFNTYSKGYSKYALYEQCQYIDFDGEYVDFHILNQYSIVIMDESYFAFSTKRKDVLISSFLEAIADRNITVVITAMDINHIPKEIMNCGYYEAGKVSVDGVTRRNGVMISNFGKQLNHAENTAVRKFFII